MKLKIACIVLIINVAAFFIRRLVKIPLEGFVDDV